MTDRVSRSLLSILGSACLFVTGQAPSRAEGPSTALVDLDSERSLAEWSSVDDRVMGGISRSRVEQASAQTVRLAGTLSLEQNGGFASIRRPIAAGQELSRADGIALRVRGDGGRYQLRLRTDGNSDGVAYRASFPTRAGEWTDVRVRFDSMVPTWRGRRVRDAPPLDPGRVRTLGFLVADKQEGFFELEIERIATWRSSTPESL